MTHVLKTISRRIVQSLNQLISYLPLCIVTCFTVPIYPILNYGFYGGNLSLYDCVSWVESRLPYVSFKHLNPLSKMATINLTSEILTDFMAVISFFLIMGIPSIIAMTYSVAMCAGFVLPFFLVPSSSINLFFNNALRDDQPHIHLVLYFPLILIPPSWISIIFDWVITSMLLILSMLLIAIQVLSFNQIASLRLVRQKLSFLDEIYTSAPNQEVQSWLLSLIFNFVFFRRYEEADYEYKEDLEKISRLKIVKQSRHISSIFLYKIQTLCSSREIERRSNKPIIWLLFIHENEICQIPDEFFRVYNLSQPNIHKAALSEIMKFNIHAAIIDKSPDSFVGPITTELKKIISKHPNLAHQATLNLAQLLY
ncbi:MAG TPA: hypothetical protein QF353_04780, partial [Gammaproteobacteria bacterium]|nr:hypothetical protein [Gammaproteobacteria bacterium]